MIDSVLLNVSKAMSEENERSSLQQVQYASNHSINRSSRPINSDSPPSRIFHMLTHNHNILLNPAPRQESSVKFRIAADSLLRIRFFHNDNIPSINLSVDPALL